MRSKWSAPRAVESLAPCLKLLSLVRPPAFLDDDDDDDTTQPHSTSLLSPVILTPTIHTLGCQSPLNSSHFLSTLTTAPRKRSLANASSTLASAAHHPRTSQHSRRRPEQEQQHSRRGRWPLLNLDSRSNAEIRPNPLPLRTCWAKPRVRPSPRRLPACLTASTRRRTSPMAVSLHRRTIQRQPSTASSTLRVHLQVCEKSLPVR